jgi:RNA ligase (TIGR02306 family)
MKNLATIQRVTNIRNHTNAESLELADVLGWQIVVKKGEFKANDLVIYIAIDTILPERSEFEFLRNKDFRIKPIRLRGEASAGICFPLSILGSGFTFLNTDEPLFVEGQDVTDFLNVKHYEKPVPPELAGQAFGGMPGFLRVTDEDNLRSYPVALSEMQGKPFYITRKDDGSSGTFFVKDGEFGVCSRRIHLKESDSNGFWKMARQYDIENVLKNAFPNMNVAIQGEVVGPGIQGNHLGLTNMEFHLFNIFDIGNRSFFGYHEMIKFCQDYNIPMVHTIQEGLAFGFTMEELIALANEQKYYIMPDKTSPAEGIVIRPQESFHSTVLNKPWSGKIINEKYKE